jgi:phosphoglycerate dehydrogenase-like enzyme
MPQTFRLHTILLLLLAAIAEASVGRGALVDETALLAAFNAGRLGHAILDVFAIEPCPVESPLWRHPCVTMTSHTAALSDGLATRNDELFFDNLTRVLTGRGLRNQAAPRGLPLRS